MGDLDALRQYIAQLTELRNNPPSIWDEAIENAIGRAQDALDAAIHDLNTAAGFGIAPGTRAARRAGRKR